MVAEQQTWLVASTLSSTHTSLRTSSWQLLLYGIRSNTAAMPNCMLCWLKNVHHTFAPTGVFFLGLNVFAVFLLPQHTSLSQSTVVGVCCVPACRREHALLTALTQTDSCRLLVAPLVVGNYPVPASRTRCSTAADCARQPRPSSTRSNTIQQRIVYTKGKVCAAADFL
jgi:hypothetical protein